MSQYLRVKNMPFSNTQSLGKLRTHMTKVNIFTYEKFQNKKRNIGTENEQGQLEMNRIHLNEVRI